MMIDDTVLYQKNVVSVYNEIADHFDVTRAYLWKSVKEFINSLDKNSVILDAGCGNGKNMCRTDCIHIGIDNSREMVKICLNKNQFAINADIKSIPFRNNYFDATTCIAVIHHLTNEDDRLCALSELIRVTKKGGLIFIQVWDDDLSERKVKKYHQIKNRNNDYLVEWTKNDNIYYRYYHLFNKLEIMKLVQKTNIKIKKFFNEKNNWVILLEK